MKADKLFMAMSTKTVVDGLWVGAGATDGDEPELLKKACDALALIKSCDPVRYKRILSDLRKIWITLAPASIGQYHADTDNCHIDSRFAASHEPAFIASVIVHEACHARMKRLGYAEPQRARMEAICLKQEYIFARRHPGGAAVRAWLDSRGAPQSENYTDMARALAVREASGAALRELGVPAWFLKVLLGISALRTRRAERRWAKRSRRQQLRS